MKREVVRHSVVALVAILFAALATPIVKHIAHPDRLRAIEAFTSEYPH